MKKLGSVYLLALPFIMWHYLSSHSLGHQNHCPFPWMPDLVCLLVGECEDARVQCFWPKWPLLAIGF